MKTIHIPTDLHDALRLIAFHQRKPIREVIETALREHLDRNPVEQAIAKAS